MQEGQSLAVGIDLGTTTVRCAVGVINAGSDEVNLVGLGEAVNIGFRKGSVVNISDVASAMDQAIGNAERMAGVQVGGATININGMSIKGLDSRGVIAVSGGEVTEDDLLRVEDAATVLQLPQHQEILSVFPRSYILDGQEGIKDPVGMSGTRLEVDAHVVTVSAPVIKNLEKVSETTGTAVHRISVGSLGAAQAVITREQRENGVAVLDIGASTSNLIVIEEGDVQLVSVIPIGGASITNDLAIGLKTDLKVAESVKKNYNHLGKNAKTRPKHIKVVVANKEYVYPTKTIELVVSARLAELFHAVDKELGRISRSKNIPGGVTLTGATSQIPGIEELAREELSLSARVGLPLGIGGLKEKVARPEYATVTGLMLLDVHKNDDQIYGGKGIGGRLQQGADQARSIFGRLRRSIGL